MYIQKFTFLIIFILSAFLFSCDKKTDPNAGAADQLFELNKKYDSALIHRDTAFLRKIYHDSLVYTSPEGKFLNKEQQILNVALSELKWESGKSEDVNVKHYNNNMAVMTGTFNASGTYRGNPLSIQERYTAIWQKNDSTWVILAEQGTIVQQ